MFERYTAGSRRLVSDSQIIAWLEGNTDESGRVVTPQHLALAFSERLAAERRHRENENMDLAENEHGEAPDRRRHIPLSRELLAVLSSAEDECSGASVEESDILYALLRSWPA